MSPSPSPLYQYKDNLSFFIVALWFNWNSVFLTIPGSAPLLSSPNLRWDATEPNLPSVTKWHLSPKHRTRHIVLWSPSIYPSSINTESDRGGNILSRDVQTSLVPSQPREIVRPACPESSWGSPSGGSFLTHLSKKASQTDALSQLSWLLLMSAPLGNWALQPVPRGALTPNSKSFL